MCDYNQLDATTEHDIDHVTCGAQQRVSRGLCIGAVMAAGFVALTFSFGAQQPVRNNGVALRGGADPVHRATALTGGDADEHGCFASAGYRWCESVSSCIRPWQQGIHEDANFTTRCSRPWKKPLVCSCPPSMALWECSQDEYDAILKGSGCPPHQRKYASAANGSQSEVGVGAKDHVHCAVCDESEVSTECRACVAGMPARDFCKACIDEGLNDVGCIGCEESIVLAGADVDMHGCRPSAGYRWCEAMTSCIRPWEEGIHGEGDFTTRCSPAKKPLLCSCPPSEALWNCTEQERRLVLDGTSCNFYRGASASLASAPIEPTSGAGRL